MASKRASTLITLDLGVLEDLERYAAIVAGWQGTRPNKSRLVEEALKTRFEALEEEIYDRNQARRHAGIDNIDSARL